MKAELAKLQAMFAHVRYTGASHTDCLLLETDPHAKIKKIEIHSGTNHRDWFLLHPDQDRTCPCLRTTKKCPLNTPHLVTGIGFHHQVCDGILVTQNAEGINVSYFDLKSNSSSGVSTQFKSMKCFVRYTLSLIDNTLPLVERAFCFKCIKCKLKPKDRFTQNTGLSSSLGVQAFDVRVDDGQKFTLSEFIR